MTPTILLYNPRSTSPGKQRLPLSLLALGAVLEPDYTFEVIDGNLVADPAGAIIEQATTSRAQVLGVTVMPGPQLEQAVPVCRAVKQAMPELNIVWGGYFPTQHYDATLRSGFVDYVIQGQGEMPFRALVDCLHMGGSLEEIPSLAYCHAGEVVVNRRGAPVSLDEIARFPYHRIDVEQYIQHTYLGKRSLPHNSSFGCPFACNFCAVVALSQRRWLAESPARMSGTLRYLQDTYNIDSVEFHDMDFFVSEARTVEFAERIADMKLSWWGLGRVDTLMSYSDDSWAKMKASGCRMIFLGAESGSDEVLARMNKGGNAATEMTLALVARMSTLGIVPELSFVLGNPPDPAADVDASLRFIRKIKEVNPATEIVIYIYTPVPEEGTLLAEARKLGFSFPQTLDEWVGDDWTTFSMRRDPGTPWFREGLRERVRDFEAVLNAYYPTITDLRLHGPMRHLLRTASGWRYKLGFYRWPYELKALQRLVHYRRPETTGF